MKKERIYGLDILRILSMLGIVGLHILNQGGWGASADTALEVLFSRIFAAVCYCSVNVFAMLTGYLYADRKTIRFSNLLKLLFTVAFYCAAILLVFMAIMPQLFDGYRGLYLYAIFPPFVGRYWYITCYVLLFMMIPYLNAMIRSLQEIHFRRLLLILFALLSVVSTFGMNDYFKLSDGYSPYWLIFCYMVGAYIRLHKNDLPKSRIPRWVTILAVDLLLVIGMRYVLGDALANTWFPILGYTSPFMVIEAAVLLLIFSKLTVQHRSMQKCIVSLSNGAFGVYIIHSHILIFDYVMADAFAWAGGSGLLGYIGASFAGLVGIYLVCWAVDIIRGFLFKWLRIDKLADLIGGKVDRFLHWA